MSATASEQDSTLVRLLWSLLTMVGGLKDEQERARLLATGLPSLLPCAVSGLVLLNDRDSGAMVRLLYKDGERLAAADTEAVFDELAPLIEEAGQGPGLWRDEAENGSDAGGIPPSLKKLDVRAMALVPIRTFHRRLGALAVGRTVPGAFSSQEQVLLLTLAEHMALGIETMRLSRMQEDRSETLQTLVNERTDSLRRSEERDRVLLEITNALVSNLDREGLLKAIAREMVKLPTFDRIGITLYDPSSDRFEICALETTAPLVSLPRGADIPRQGSGMGWAFDHRETLYRPHLPDGHRFFEDEHFIADGLQSVVYLPLMTGGRVLGTLQVASKTASRYSEEDIAFLSHVTKQLALAIDNALAYEEVKALRDQLHRENAYLLEEIKSDCNFEEIIGESPALRRALHNVGRVAATDSTVLIWGETGTGKELIARTIHNCSPRSSRPLIKVNCAALPAGLVESELFGHEKGSFTGALGKKIGRFELANRGTIFLDEIGDVPLETQVKLLRVLQEQEFERVGGTGTIKVDVRVIAATNRDLSAAVAQQSFRADLFYRLNVFPITVPPLRERGEDIPILARHFLRKHMKGMRKVIEGIAPAGLDRLMRYAWPGNIRELENLIERAVILCQGPMLEIGEEALPLSRTPGAPSGEEFPTLEGMERTYILKVLRRTKGMIGGKDGAAAILKLHPNTLRSRLDKLGIKKSDWQVP